MFLLGLFVGILIGSNLAIAIYACILAGKKADERTYM